MSIQVGGVDFDHATYDASSGVLYLRSGPQAAAADTEATPEGHAVRRDRAGQVIGITLVNAQWLLDRDGEVGISGDHVTDRLPASALAPLLASR